MRQDLALPAPPTPPGGGETPPPPAPTPPQAVIVELTLNFFQSEIDQLDRDASFMARKGLLHAGEDQLSRLTVFIRHAALAHTHQAVMKEMGKDLAVVDEAKRVAVEVTKLKGVFEGRIRELDQREAHIGDKERALEELQVKYLALLEGLGLLEEQDGEGT